MTNRELGDALKKSIAQERVSTNEVLKLINLGFQQRAYVEHGYSSMYDWLTKGFGYSNGSAYRRIQAAKMLRSVPEVSEKLENGGINLSTLCKAQVLISAHEKKSGTKVELQQKTQILHLIENKSEVESERDLLKMLPDASSKVFQVRRKNIDDLTVRHSLNLDINTSQKLDRAKELLSHKLFGATDSEIVTYAIDFLLEHIDPLWEKSADQITNQTTTEVVSNKNPAARTHCNIEETSRSRVRSRYRSKSQNSKALKIKYKAANGACTYKDPISKKLCGSRYQVQWDHVTPKALGGSNKPENFRLLCREHNMYFAEQLLGRSKMERYRK